MSFDATGVDEFGVTRTVTVSNVRAFWDNWFGIQAGNRENVVSWGGDGGEDLTYNCYTFSFGFSGIWINNPDPIYEDDWESTNNPTEGDIIRIPGHVITITSINHCELPHPVIGTTEKWRHSGYYHFLYDYSTGIGGDTYKDFLRRKWSAP
jgi:hypothetical protein